MNGFRKAFGFLMVLMLATFALPALAHGDDEKFTFTTDAAATSSVPFMARIKNVAQDDDDKIKSFTITSADPNVRITSATITGGTGTYLGYTPPTIGAGGVTSVTFKNVSVKQSKYLDVALTATFPAATSCGLTPYVWNPKAYEGSNASGEQFSLVSSPTTVRTTSVTNIGTLLLAFDAVPTNVAQGAAFDVKVRRTSSCGITPPGPEVALSLGGTNAFTAGTPLMTGVLIIGNKFGAIGAATLTASASGYTSAVAPVTVVTAAGTLPAGACENPSAPGGGATFNASTSGATEVTDPAFLSGYRGLKTACPAVSFLATNNVTGAPGVADAQGYILPSNAVSVVFESTDAVLSYVVTTKAETVAAGAQPQVDNRAKYCKPSDPLDKDCTIAANQVPLPTCLSPEALATSVPAGAPACLAGVAWTNVAPSACGTGNVLACVTFTLRILDKRDPPIMWD